MNEQVKKRQSWVDFARGIAIILVVYRHVFDGLNNTAALGTYGYMFLFHLNTMFFSFRMPLFFIVSGIFLASSYTKRGFKRYTLNKGYTILYPYLVWGGLQIAIQVFFSDYTNKDWAYSDFLTLLYNPRQTGQFWYLNALFGVSVLYALMKYIVKIKFRHQVILGLIFFYGASLLHRYSINLGFLLDIFSYYIFIVIGDGISKFMRDTKNLEFLQSYKLVLWLAVPFFVAQLIFLYLNYHHPEVGGYRYVEYFMPTLFLIIVLIGCSFIIALSFQFQKFEAPQWLKSLGSYSLYIYVAHVAFASGTRVFLIKVFNLTNVPVLFILVLIAGLFLPVLLYKVARRLSLEWIFKLDENKIRWSRTEEQKPVSNNVLIR